MSPLRVDVRTEPGAVRVSVHGELDLEGAPTLQEAVPEDAAAPVVLDLAGVTFVDSSGLAAVVRTVDDTGGRVEAPFGSEARLSIELAGLAERVRLHPPV